jgi:calcineurin-like phosphoesterase
VALDDVAKCRAMSRRGREKEMAAEIARAGADTFVAGSAVFGSKNYEATVDSMRAGLRPVIASKLALGRFVEAGADRAGESVPVRIRGAHFVGHDPDRFIQ